MLLLRYVKNGKPVERLIEYIMCESITAAALCEDIQQTLIKLKLNLQNSVSQTYDGVANFSGQMKVCASLFHKTVPQAQYFHHSDHDLNLALCHTSHGMPEVRDMPYLCDRNWIVLQVFTIEGTVVRICYHS